jgi:hypothetical protein
VHASCIFGGGDGRDYFFDDGHVLRPAWSDFRYSVSFEDEKHALTLRFFYNSQRFHTPRRCSHSLHSIISLLDDVVVRLLSWPLTFPPSGHTHPRPPRSPAP